MTTFHEILGTTDQSTKSEIKARYRKLSNQCHPDKGGSAELFKLVKLAYEKVSKGYGKLKAYENMQSSNDPELEALAANITYLEAVIQALREQVNTLGHENLSKQRTIERLQREARNRQPPPEPEPVEKESNSGLIWIFIFVAVMWGLVILNGKSEPEIRYVDKVVYRDRVEYKTEYVDRIEYMDRIEYVEIQTNPDLDLSGFSQWKTNEHYDDGGRYAYVDSGVFRLSYNCTSLHLESQVRLEESLYRVKDIDTNKVWYTHTLEPKVIRDFLNANGDTVMINGNPFSSKGVGDAVTWVHESCNF